MAIPYKLKITLGLDSNNYEGVKPAAKVRMSPLYSISIPIIQISSSNSTFPL